MIQASRASSESARLATVAPLKPPRSRPGQMISSVSITAWSSGPVGVSAAGGNS